MSNVKVTNELNTYPGGGGTGDPILIRSHWNYTDRVLLVVEGKEYCLIASDLHKAINNAVNH